MDTSSTPTSPEAGTSSLTTEQAGAAFAAMLDPVDPPKKEEAEPAKAEPETAQPNEQVEGDDAPLSEQEGNEIVTVLVDGKPVELTKAQIAEAHKSGLRQADYTKKTTELAEQRKAAEAETAKARAERDQYAQGLQRAAAVLEGQLQQQQNIDWQKLLETDPVEYLKQQHLAQTRQAQLQQTYQQQSQIQAQASAEQEAALKEHVASQRSELIAKIPEWKDEAKLKAGAAEVRDYLLKQGLKPEQVNAITDHRAIVNSYKAMKYDEMMAKASTAAKKIENVPQRVARPSGGDAPVLDRRTVDYQRFNKSGSVEDAGRLFANLF